MRWQQPLRHFDTMPAEPDLRSPLRGELILCIGGLDPSGGAGLSADLSMVVQLGGRAAMIPSCQTVQGRRHWRGLQATSPTVMRQQWNAILADDHPAAIKVGALPELDQARMLAGRLQALNCPVVLDPVLGSSSGGALTRVTTLTPLLPYLTLLTPNRAEYAALRRAHHTLPPCLVTDGDGADTLIQNTLLDGRGETRMSWRWRRRPGRYRGTGCLLSAAIAAWLASDCSLTDACARAQAEVDCWLARAWMSADGVHCPRPPT